MSLGGRFWLKAMMPSQLCDELGQCVHESGRLYCAVKTSVCNWSQGHTGDPNGSRGPLGFSEPVAVGGCSGKPTVWE